MTEEIIYQARLHWILLVWPILFLLVDLFIGVQFPLFWLPALLFGGVICIWFIVTWSMYYFSTLTVVDKHLILRTGVFVRQTIDIPLNKIESIDIRQPFFGMILGYGTLTITGTGGTHELVNYLQRPLTCRRYIEQTMNK